MPLPAPSQEWPPKQITPITRKHAEWDAWYVGDPEGLSRVYQGPTAAQPWNRPSQYRGGVVGAAARMWWGKPVTNLTQPDQDRLHVPIASDLCQASADLLFAEPPSLGSTDATAQKELDLAAEQGLVSAFAEGAEIGAALGDVYYRVTWDTQLRDRSFIVPVHADAAWPEFRWGQLVAVTFWWVVRQDGQVVVRHLERHELDNAGNGVIFHGLYEGTADNLGRQVPLAEDTSTAGIVVDEQSMISTQSPGLAVAQAPNQRPQRRWRNHPVGANLGRSDLDGVEPIMDKLDMVYSAWMRDVRLAKARLLVPGFMLESGGVGQGAFFDSDQDIFTTVNAPPREDGQSQITPQQFAIRVDEHQRTAQQLVEDILRTAGYSKQTFGEGAEGGAVTATEVVSKDRRSNLTRDRKIRAIKPALHAIVRKKLAVDAALFRSGVAGWVDLTLEFVDTTQADPEVTARTALALRQAEAASTKTLVAMSHPDWDEKQIKGEVAAILAESGRAVTDPTAFPV